jgi:hypothetical protein
MTRYFLMRCADSRSLGRAAASSRWPVSLGSWERLNEAFATGGWAGFRRCLRCMAVLRGGTAALMQVTAALAPAKLVSSLYRLAVLPRCAVLPALYCPAGEGVVLIFTVTGSGNFQGCARMTSAAEEGVRALLLPACSSSCCCCCCCCRSWGRVGVPGCCAMPCAACLLACEPCCLPAAARCPAHSTAARPGSPMQPQQAWATLSKHRVLPMFATVSGGAGCHGGLPRGVDQAA